MKAEIKYCTLAEFIAWLNTKGLVHNNRTVFQRMGMISFSGEKPIATRSVGLMELERFVEEFGACTCHIRCEQAKPLESGKSAGTQLSVLFYFNGKGVTYKASFIRTTTLEGLPSLDCKTYVSVFTSARQEFVEADYDGLMSVMTQLGTSLFDTPGFKVTMQSTSLAPAFFDSLPQNQYKDESSNDSIAGTE